MITKERLKELIEQGAKVWCVCDYSYDKSNPNKKVEYYDFSYLSDEYKRTDLDIDNYISSVEEYTEFFETKEEAEWHKEFGNITRTIKLDLPKWEDIEKEKNFHYIRHFVISKNFSFFMEVYKFTNTISVSWSGGCKKTDPRFDKNWELTKENYTLACRKCKELFLGGKNESSND